MDEELNIIKSNQLPEASQEEADNGTILIITPSGDVKQADSGKMKGASGEDGKTPVIENAPTSHIASDLPAEVTLTLVGTDENGNPIYRQNAAIPMAMIPIHVGTEEPTDPNMVIWFDTRAFNPLRLLSDGMRLTSSNNIRI